MEGNTRRCRICGNLRAKRYQRRNRKHKIKT
jgi:hypothetical protein